LARVLRGILGVGGCGPRTVGGCSRFLGGNAARFCRGSRYLGMRSRCVGCLAHLLKLLADRFCNAAKSLCGLAIAFARQALQLVGDPSLFGIGSLVTGDFSGVLGGVTMVLCAVPVVFGMVSVDVCLWAWHRMDHIAWGHAPAVASIRSNVCAQLCTAYGFLPV
jgi:hypothetical protein